MRQVFIKREGNPRLLLFFSGCPFLLYKRGCKFREITSARIMPTHEIPIIIYYSEDYAQFQSPYRLICEFLGVRLLLGIG